jgi:hypothetical protein
MDRQEQQIKALMAAQTATFKSIFSQQEKSFQKTLNRINSKLPTMVSSRVEGLLPTIIKQMQSKLALFPNEPETD